MNEPYGRVYNFSAGPCTLPVEVLEEARDGLMNYKGAGMSVMEMSHRGKVFEGILDDTRNQLRKILSVPENFQILFLQGGASTQFSMVAMNFLCKGTADYITTGTWGAKGFESAALEGNAKEIFSGKSTNFDRLPCKDDLQFSPNAQYVYYTSNETVQGVEFKGDQSFPGHVVCDMSSDILSRPIDFNKYALIHAGAQKNMGPAGATVVIISDDMIDRVPQGLSPMFDYRVQAQNGSMYNTPPCWSIYMCGLTYHWVERQGGVTEMQKRAQKRSGLLYEAIDGSNGFYKGHSQKDCRSIMNVTFTLPNEDVTKTFVKEAEAAGFDGVKGHRATGGIRASIYNAFPVQGCVDFATFMKEFAGRNY